MLSGARKRLAQPGVPQVGEGRGRCDVVQPGELHSQTPKGTLRPPPGVLWLWLETSAGERFRGSLVDVEGELGACRISIDFARRQVADLPVGANVNVLFRKPREEKVTRVAGKVIYRIEDRFRMRFQLIVGNVPRIIASTSVSHGRACARVEPFPGVDVPVTVQNIDGGRMHRAILRDISATGLALLLSVKDEPELFSLWRLKVVLHLPTSDEPVELIGHVCHRRRFGTRAVRYGIDFDQQETQDFENKQNLVFGYVAGCQAGWLRRLASEPKRPTGT